MIFLIPMSSSTVTRPVTTTGADHLSNRARGDNELVAFSVKTQGSLKNLRSQLRAARGTILSSSSCPCSVHLVFLLAFAW